MAGSIARSLLAVLLFVLAAALAAGMAYLMFTGDVNEDFVPIENNVAAISLVASIVLAAIVFALIILLLTRSWSRKATFAEEAEVFFVPESPRAAAPTTEYEVAPDVTVYDLRKVPVGARAWSSAEVDGKQHPFYFPQEVAGGIYVNDYIPIDNKWKLLKLRTLLGGPYDVGYADTSVPQPRRAAQPTAAPERAAPALAPAIQDLLLQEVPAETIPAQPVVEESYFDYPGDNHEVEDLEGIGPTYGRRLRDAGVHTTARLAYEDAAKLAEAVQVPRGTVEAWKQMAELVKVKGIGPQYAEALVRAGVTGIAELKRRSPTRMAEQINGYLATLDVNVIGNKITEKRVESWKESAKALKRVKLQVPPQ